MFLELIGLVALPVITVIGLVLFLGEDFLQLITFRMDFTRFFGDLVHVFVFLIVMVLLFAADIFMLLHGFI